MATALFVNEENAVRGIKIAGEKDIKLVQIILTPAETTTQGSVGKIFCAPMIIQAASVTNDVNQKSIISLNNRQYLYVFGDNIASLEISGLVLNYEGGCKKPDDEEQDSISLMTESGPITPLLYYLKYAVSSAVFSNDNLGNYVITVVFAGNTGSSVLKGFLVGSQVIANDPETRVTKCSFTLIPIRPTKRNFDLFESEVQL